MAKKIPASDEVRSEWARRVEAEYRSAAITHHLTHWLIQAALSPDVIHMGLRIVKDELAHASMSHRTLLVAGGSVTAPIARETLQVRRKEDEPLELSIARTCVEVFCLGETVAVPLFKVLREGCTVPAARRTLDRVLRDEVRHRDFGWTLLDHLLETPAAPGVRRLVTSELPRMFARIHKSYAPVGGSKHAKIPEEDRAWGLMPIARYREILERSVDRDYVPRFSARGFDARAAWSAAMALVAA